MADELEADFGFKTKLIRSGGGIFDVVVDDKKVFSKFNTGRFPDPGEVSKIIKAM